MQGDYDSITREPCFRDHRFDFSLSENLSGDRDKLFIELKSVTLAWDNTASFPDAPTIRGVEHIRALSDSRKGMLVFLIFHSNIDYFIPNYHTDFEFYKTLVDHKENIQISAFSVEYGVNLDINGLKEVEIILPHVKPSGSYLLIYSNSSCRIADVGHLGGISFPEGFYIYVGSGKKNLFKRIEYHRRNSVKKHWHVDYIKNHFKLIMDIPIVTHRDIECILAEKIIELGGKGIKGFGSSDCRCNSHFFFFASNPLYSEDFWDMILEERLSIL